MMNISSENKTKLNITFMMVALALIALATATYAWFSLSLSTKVNTMDLEVTAGTHLKIDVASHNSLDLYKNEVDQTDVERQLTYSLDSIKVDPLTSSNGTALFNQKKLEVAKTTKKFLEFDLYFMASAPMDVYLTEENSAGNTDGTNVSSKSGNTEKQKNIERCVRLSFQPEGGAATMYEPNKNGNTTLDVLGGGIQNTFTGAKTGEANSKIFSLTGGNLQEKVTVRVWIEGDDTDCNEDVISSKFSTRLRFEGLESTT